MSGAVMVLPRGGLIDAAGKPLHYDRVYYIGEQDFYVPRDAKGKFKTYNSHGDAFADTMEVMRKLIPTHVVFNGGVGALTGKHAMLAMVGGRTAFTRRSRLPSVSGWRSWRHVGRPQARTPGLISDVVHPRRVSRRGALMFRSPASSPT
jgi:FtsP/CotA-like multicopper oxidase with cupredoxin domain